MRRPSRLELLLSVAATLLTLLALEVAFRGKLWVDNRHTFDSVFRSEGAVLDLAQKGRPTLGRIIRRSRNPQIIYELKANLSIMFQGAPLTTNQYGFRGKDHVPGRSAAFRIVGLGDSFMFGQGVADGEEYLAVLEQRLNHTYQHRRWEVVNTAVSGYNTVMEVATLEEKGLKYEPDVVVIEFVANDLSLPNFIRLPEPLLTVRKSFLAAYLRERLVDAPRVDEPSPTYQELAQEARLIPAPRHPNRKGTEDDPARVPPQYRHMVGWEAYGRALADLRDLQDEHGFEVVSLFLAPARSPLKTRAMEVADAMGFHVVDVGAVLRTYMQERGIVKHLGSPLTVSETDGHPSVLGHTIAAEVLLDYLVRQDLLDLGAVATAPGS